MWHFGSGVWCFAEPGHQALVFVAKGATVPQQPTNYQWAYEMRIEYSNGHVLRFGLEPKADGPIVRGW